MNFKFNLKFNHNSLPLQKERRFEKKMKKKGLIIKKMREDGACLFRAIADQVYGDQDMHSSVRKNCMDYIVSLISFFSSPNIIYFTVY